jgi:iron complex outermembrane receptor protein
MSLQLYYDRTHLVDPVPANATTGEPAGTLTDDLDTYDLDFQHRFSLGERNHIVWGLGYRFTHEVDNNAPALEFLPPTLDQNLFNLFGQDQITLLKNLFLTLGTKIEHNDYTGFEFEPSGRLQWNVAQKQMIWAAVSRAVRTPSRVDEDERVPFAPPTSAIFPNLLTGNSDFESETVIAYELGYRAQLSKKVSTSISTFYNDYEDVRSTGVNPVTILPFEFQNNLHGETYGVELSADYQIFDWWRLHGGYDLLKEHIRVEPGKTDINDALNETSDPQQQFQIRSSMDLPANVDLDAGLRWVDTLVNNNGTTRGIVPSYFEMDVRIGWRPTKHLELSIVGQNLLHDQHPEYGFPSPTREEIERSVFGKVSYNW